MDNEFLKISEAVQQIKNGKMIILVDHPNRENEGDFFFPAALADSEKVNTAIKLGGGILCVAVSPEIALRLNLPLAVSPSENTEQTQVNFAVSVNAKNRIKSGVSAFDRAETIKVLGDLKSSENDLTRPGHVFPLVADGGGILKREGHTEAAVELSRLAGFSEAGVLCEILNEEGKMASREELFALSKKLGIGIISLDDLKEYVSENPKEYNDKSIIKTASSKLPTKFGDFIITVYKSIKDNKEHVALSLGDKLKNPVLVRIHSLCLTGDTLFSRKCDCGDQLRMSLERIAQKGQGVLVYLNQEGRGIGLSNKIRAYALQDEGMDTVEANVALGLPVDGRDFKTAFEILEDLGIEEIDLLTNNPEKAEEICKDGIKIHEVIPLIADVNDNNKDYLLTKKNKLGHILDL